MNEMIAKFALNMLQNNPRVRDSQLGQELMRCIQTGDSARGEQIANNLCQTYGDTREAAIEKAQKHFGFFR